MKRRKFLKNTLASCVLGLGGISAYQLYLQSNNELIQDDPFDYQFLSHDDRILLQVLIPVFISSENPLKKAITNQIQQNIDNAISLLPERTQAELRELFNLLGSMLGRVLLARVWLNWQAASLNSLDQFISDWRDSSIDLLQTAYRGLHKLIIGSYYSESLSWEQIGYLAAQTIFQQISKNKIPMTIDYQQLNHKNYATELPEKQIECDVAIIGSGAGGGISAEILARSGLKVLIVEEGPLRTAKDFKMQEKTAYADLYHEVAGRQTLDKGIQILQGRSVGGSTTVNWTSSFRTPTRTLNYWQHQFSVEGLSSEQLLPWFNWVEKRLNISPWAIPPNKNNQLLADGAKKLGWKYAVIPRNVKGCANLGYCGMGCPINAKQSMLVTTIPTALEHGARLISRARAESLIIENNQVKGLWLTSMDSFGQIKQKDVTQVIAKKVVLSAGAIGSPSVLLRSHAPDPFKVLGRRTFLHPVTATIAKMPNKVEAFSGAPQSIYSDEFVWRDGESGELGYKLEVPPMHPVLSSTLLLKHGKNHQALIKDLPYYQANLALLRDGFHPESIGGQVSLDTNGYPQLDYNITPVLWRGLRAAMLSMSELQFANGAEKVIPLHMDAELQSSWKKTKTMIENLSADHLRWQTLSAHVMGGCGMGKEPQHSVVNSQGEHHQLENLNVIDGSLFPTSLGVNPQLTIYAIAAKLSSILAKKLGGQLPDDFAN